MKKFMAVLAMVAVVAFAAPVFAATNPFMDVPQGHWAYDAVALLASRGIISGYPDGAFKGAQPATRYEVASMIARALVAFDADKASKQDLELLKKLVMEFKDELDALGVKVDKLDARVAALEKNLGGWKLSGQFWFDANFSGGDQGDYGMPSSYSNTGNDTEFVKDRFRLTLQKQISDTTSFYAQFRGGAEGVGAIAHNDGAGDVIGMNVRQVYVDTVLPFGIDYRVGRFFLDFEDDHGLYADNDAIFGDFRVDGFQFAKSWGSIAAKAVIGRNTDFLGSSAAPDIDYMTYALDLSWQPNEKFFIGVNGVWFVNDGDNTITPFHNGDKPDTDFSTYSVYASYNFTPAIALQGTYYFQDLDAGLLQGATEDSPQAWRATLDLGQDLLKFTGLRFEYQEQDNTFNGVRDPYSFGVDSAAAASIAYNMPWNDGTTKMFFIYAAQEWNEKWSSYLRYQQADFDTSGYDDAKGYGIGVTYQYTPAVAFRLAYDQVDYGTGLLQTYQDKDHVFQFRTAINF